MSAPTSAWCARHASTAVVKGDNGHGPSGDDGAAAEIAIEKARRATRHRLGQFAILQPCRPCLALRDHGRFAATTLIGLYFAGRPTPTHPAALGPALDIACCRPIRSRPRSLPDGEKPIVLDMATTGRGLRQGGKPKALRGETMPEGWMIDREGQAAERSETRRGKGMLLCRSAAWEAGYKGLLGSAHDHRPAGGGTLGGAAMGPRTSSIFNHETTTASPTTGQAIGRHQTIAAFGDVAVLQGPPVEYAGAPIFRRPAARMPGVERIFRPRASAARPNAARSARATASRSPPPLMRGLDQVADETGHREARIVLMRQ